MNSLVKNSLEKEVTLNNCIVLLMGFAGTGKLTIAKKLIKHPNFRLVDNHTWNNPIFNLIRQDGITPIPEIAWQKSGKICDVIFETMRELSPTDFSFVITQEMIDGDAYPEQFYERVSQLVNDRKSTFLPVRLLCNESELIKRVQLPERRDFYKTIDAERASRLVRYHEVFHSHHPNELTIDVTAKKPVEVVEIILKKLNDLLTYTSCK